ncbi:MAG: serine/threonine-protein kinase [Chloroflexi bacterium]|nr:serine/threonine-protein kinase [Chloroflexota bacterium]
MGAVYRARDLHFPNVTKVVAVKEMVNQARDPKLRQTILDNFEREANILATLNHPSIPRIYDYFTHQERSYLVIEYIPGKDLEAMVAEMDAFLPQEQVVMWAIELCDVLHYLHSHKPEPIIFRDMKPSNVMITLQNHVVLVDFGIAKIFRMGQKGTMIGTEGYSPPEQYRGEATQLADIYALGATLHHVLTRKDPRLEPPFTFEERSIRAINPSVSPEFETIINTCLSYAPEKRFPNAEKMKEALQGILHDQPTQRNRLDMASISGQAIGVKPLWTFTCEDEIRGSPALDKDMLLVGAYDTNLYAINAADGKFVWKYATEGGIVGKPAVYENIAYIGSEDHRLHAVSTRSGKVLWTYFTDGPIRSSVRIMEGHLFFGSDDNYLHAVNISSNRRVWKVEAPGPIRSTPYILNDLVYFGCEDGEVFCIDFRGDVKWRFKSKRAVTSSPIVDKGAVYFGSLDGTLYSVDAKSGWAMWRFRLGKGTISSPAKADNLVFIGSADGYIYCVDAATAREVWRFQTEYQVSGSPVVYRDSVYCGSADGYVYCLEYHTGRLRWKYQTGGPITGTPLVYNDILYIGSSDHVLYALIA